MNFFLDSGQPVDQQNAHVFSWVHRTDRLPEVGLEIMEGLFDGGALPKILNDFDFYVLRRFGGKRHGHDRTGKHVAAGNFPRCRAAENLCFGETIVHVPTDARGGMLHGSEKNHQGGLHVGKLLLKLFNACFRGGVL